MGLGDKISNATEAAEGGRSPVRCHFDHDTDTKERR